MDEKSHVTPIINNQVRSVTLTITLRLYEGIKYSSPVLPETPTIPVKHSSIFVILNDSHSVVLGRENVARSPTEVTAEGLESLNQHYRLYGHVERSIDTVAARYLKSMLCWFP